MTVSLSHYAYTSVRISIEHAVSDNRSVLGDFGGELP